MDECGYISRRLRSVYVLNVFKDSLQYLLLEFLIF